MNKDFELKLYKSVAFKLRKILKEGIEDFERNEELEEKTMVKKKDD